MPCLFVDAATLEMKSEKKNAHTGDISSVAFNPVDGKTIVSCSYEMIKVWDAGVLEPLNRLYLAKLTPPSLPGSHAGAEEREGQRPRLSDQFRWLFS